MPANSLPSPARADRCSPISPSAGRAEASASNMRAAAMWSVGCRAVTVDQRNAAHGLAATTRTGSIGRVPHRVERRPISRLAGTVDGRRRDDTTRRTSLDPRCVVERGDGEIDRRRRPRTAPCQMVASPSRIVGCPRRSSNVGGDVGRVSTDHTVTTAAASRSRADRAAARSARTRSARRRRGRTEVGDVGRHGGSPSSVTGVVNDVGGRHGWSAAELQRAPARERRRAPPSTTVRPDAWLIHISGFTVMRWASTGSATALTSSGVT